VGHGVKECVALLNYIMRGKVGRAGCQPAVGLLLCRRSLETLPSQQGRHDLAFACLRRKQASFHCERWKTTLSLCHYKGHR